MEKVKITTCEESVKYMDTARKKIFKNELASMKDIEAYIYGTFDQIHSTWLYRDYYIEQALKDYIIHCEVEEKVPVSGF